MLLLTKSSRIFGLATAFLLCTLSVGLNYITTFDLKNSKLDLLRPDISGHHITGYINDTSGNLVYSINSESMYQYPEDDKLHLSNFNLVSFKPMNGYSSISLLGKDGYLNSSDKTMFIGSNATLDMIHPEESKCLKIIGSAINISLDKLYMSSESHITATQGKSIISADGFSYDNKTQYLKLNSKVRITYVQ